MIDTKAFRSVSYGLYIVSSADGNTRAGCVINTFQQVTSDPAQVSIAINKENFTTGIIQSSGHFAVSVLGESAPMELIGTFGFHSSADTDKFAEAAYATDASGVPYITDHACARFSAEVVQQMDVGSHIIFIARVQQAEVLSKEPPMTYAYYHQVKGGKTPPKASSFNPDVAQEEAPATQGKVAWRCTVCGHIEYVDELPEDFVCPLCGVGRDMFERIEL